MFVATASVTWSSTTTLRQFASADHTTAVTIGKLSTKSYFLRLIVPYIVGKKVTQLF